MHGTVSELERNVKKTHAMISGIHHTIVKGPEGGSGKNLSVSVGCVPSRH